MKLVYKLKEDLVWIHNFLSYSLYKKLHNFTIGNRKLYETYPTNTYWQHESLTNNLNTPHGTYIADEQVKSMMSALIKHQPFMKLNKDAKIGFSLHRMTKGSGINWHEDSHADFAATYYLNRRWNKDWGGEFMFKTKEESGFIPIVGNSLILIKTPLIHKVNPVLNKNISRYSIQCFIK